MVYMGIYMVSQRGLSLSEYGVIVLATSVVQSWAQGAAGLLSDRLGRRPVMGTALMVRSVVIVGLGLLVSADAPVLVLAAVLVVSSSLRGAFEPVAYAFVADVVKPSDRVAAFGLQRMGTNLGWAVGPALGGFLLEVIDYGTVFYCAAPALLVSAFMVWRLVEPPRTEASGVDAKPARVSVLRALVAAFREPVGALFLAGVFIYAISHLQLFTTLSVYAKEGLKLSESEIGRVYSVNAAVVLAFQLPAVALIGRLGTSLSLVAGSLVISVAFFFLGQATAFAGVALAVAVLTVGEVFITPAQQAVVAELKGSEGYGRAFGVMGTVTMLGVAVGPLIGGITFDSIGPPEGSGALMWGVLATLPLSMAAAFAIFSAVRKRRERS